MPGPGPVDRPGPVAFLPRRRPVAGLITLVTVVMVTAVTGCGLLAGDDGSGHEGLQLEPNGTVVRVVDGDTVVVETDGTEERARLIGIDTPESVREDHPVECFGPEASSRLEQLLPPGTPIYLERDVEPRDMYNRLLVYVRRADDGLHVNRDQIAQGYGEASPYPPNTALSDELAAAEQAARTHGLGLWGECGGPDVPVGPPPDQ